MKTEKFNIWTYTFEKEKDFCVFLRQSFGMKAIVYETFYYTCKSESLAIVFNFYFASITIFIPFL